MVETGSMRHRLDFVAEQCHADADELVRFALQHAGRFCISGTGVAATLGTGQANDFVAAFFADGHEPLPDDVWRRRYGYDALAAPRL